MHGGSFCDYLNSESLFHVLLVLPLLDEHCKLLPESGHFGERKRVLLVTTNMISTNNIPKPSHTSGVQHRELQSPSAESNSPLLRYHC